MPKRVQLRSVAADDIETALAHYLAQGGRASAERFLDAVERALSQIGRHPHSGSLRFAYELDIPGLRTWPVPRLPYLVFYVEHDTHLDVWRVLHTRRDIPATLADNGQS